MHSHLNTWKWCLNVCKVAFTKNRSSLNLISTRLPLWKTCEQHWPVALILQFLNSDSTDLQLSNHWTGLWTWIFHVRSRFVLLGERQLTLILSLIQHHTEMERKEICQRERNNNLVIWGIDKGEGRASLLQLTDSPAICVTFCTFLSTIASYVT